LKFVQFLIATVVMLAQESPRCPRAPCRPQEPCRSPAGLFWK